MQNAFPPIEALENWNGLAAPTEWRKLPVGFSGARLWRHGQFVLKEHVNGVAPHRLEELQRWLEWLRPGWIGEFAYVPRAIRSRSGSVGILVRNHCWEMMEFKEGIADFDVNPSGARLSQVIKAIGSIHQVWAETATTTRLMPAVERRYRIFQLGLDRWRNNRAMLDWIIRPEARDAGLLHLVKRIPELIERERLKLRTIEHLHVECHPCLCDIHHDHLLFTGDKLTGLIDFSAAKIDHPAVDLARLFGSLFPDDKQRWHDAFNMYEGDFPFEWIEILESSGLVGAAIFWFDKLLYNPNPDERVMKRVGEIVARLRES